MVVAGGGPGSTTICRPKLGLVGYLIQTPIVILFQECPT